MQRVRTIAIGSLVAAFAITILGVFAVAAPTKSRVAIVNGWPGRTVDVCINGKEAKSGLGYGGKIFRAVGNGRNVLKFYSRDARTCRGTLLGKRTFDPPAGGTDLTIVLTRRAPKKVLLFKDSKYYDSLEAGHGAAAFRYAGNLGAVKIILDAIEGPNPIAPAATPSASPWAKGDEAGGDGTPDDIGAYRVRATRASTGKRLTKTPFQRLRAGRFQESILVGTNARNAKFVQFSRKVPTASPTAAP